MFLTPWSRAATNHYFHCPTTIKCLTLLLEKGLKLSNRADPQIIADLQCPVRISWMHQESQGRCTVCVLGCKAYKSVWTCISKHIITRIHIHPSTYISMVLREEAFSPSSFKTVSFASDFKNDFFSMPLIISSSSFHVPIYGLPFCLQFLVITFKELTLNVLSKYLSFLAIISWVLTPNKANRCY